MSDENGDSEEVFPSSPATLLSHEEVRPQFVGKRKTSMSRVAAYRRKLRRERNRRISLIIAFTIALVAAGMNYKVKHPEFKLQKFVAVETLNVGPLDDYLDRVAQRTQKSFSKRSKAPSKSTAKNESIISSESSADIEQPKEEKEPEEESPADTNEDVGAEDILDANTELEDESTEMAEEIALGQEQEEELDEPEINEKDEQVQQQQQQQQQQQGERQDDRPALCNIPLAYLVHGKCRRLASQNPVFNLKGLVEDMMQ